MTYLSNAMSDRTTISIRSDVYSKLKEHGRFGESFSDLVSRLMQQSELRGKD
jgi:predicted CopG family antitoxin